MDGEPQVAEPEAAPAEQTDVNSTTEIVTQPPQSSVETEPQADEAGAEEPITQDEGPPAVPAGAEVPAEPEPAVVAEAAPEPEAEAAPD